MVVGSQDGMPPYLLGYKGYSLVPLLMIQHKKRKISVNFGILVQSQT